MARPPKQPEKWYRKPWFGIPVSNRITIRLLGVGVTIFSTGYIVGNWEMKNEKVLSEIILRQECMEKLTAKDKECQESKTAEFKNITDTLVSGINKIAKKNEK